MSKVRKHTKGNNDPLNGLNLNNLDLVKIFDIISKLGIKNPQEVLDNIGAKGDYIQQEHKDKEGTSSSRKKEISDAVYLIMNADKAEVLEVVLSLYGANNSKAAKQNSDED